MLKLSIIQPNSFFTCWLPFLLGLFSILGSISIIASYLMFRQLRKNSGRIILIISAIQIIITMMLIISLFLDDPSVNQIECSIFGTLFYFFYWNQNFWHLYLGINLQICIKYKIDNFQVLIYKQNIQSIPKMLQQQERFRKIIWITFIMSSIQSLSSLAESIDVNTVGICGMKQNNFNIIFNLIFMISMNIYLFYIYFILVQKEIVKVQELKYKAQEFINSDNNYSNEIIGLNNKLNFMKNDCYYILTFIVCWTPFSVLNIIDYIRNKENNQIKQYFYDIIQIIMLYMLISTGIIHLIIRMFQPEVKKCLEVFLNQKSFVNSLEERLLQNGNISQTKESFTNQQKEQINQINLYDLMKIMMNLISKNPQYHIDIITQKECIHKEIQEFNLPFTNQNIEKESNDSNMITINEKITSFYYSSKVFANINKKYEINSQIIRALDDLKITDLPQFFKENRIFQLTPNLSVQFIGKRQKQFILEKFLLDYYNKIMQDDEHSLPIILGLFSFQINKKNFSFLIQQDQRYISNLQQICAYVIRPSSIQKKTTLNQQVIVQKSVTQKLYKNLQKDLKFLAHLTSTSYKLFIYFHQIENNEIHMINEYSQVNIQFKNIFKFLENNDNLDQSKNLNFDVSNPNIYENSISEQLNDLISTIQYQSSLANSKIQY